MKINNYLIVILAIIALVLIVGVMKSIVGEKSQNEFLVMGGKEIPKSSGYCLSELRGFTNNTVESVDISPCNVRVVIYYPDPLYLQKDLPEGTKRGVTLKKDVLSLMPEGTGITLLDGNVKEGWAKFFVQSPGNVTLTFVKIS